MTEEQRERKKLQAKTYREKNKDKLRQYNKGYSKQYNKQYYLNHKESVLQQHKQYRLDHRESVLQHKKQYRALNKEKIAILHKQNYLKNKDKLKQYNKEYNMDHKEELREKKKQYRNGHKNETALRAKKYCINNKEKEAISHRIGHLRRDFGITQEQYNEIFANQDGKCIICGKHQKELKMALAVDHDHSTNEVRGLLCGPCNRGLGMFKDDPDLLQKALDYLRKDNKFWQVSSI